MSMLTICMAAFVLIFLLLFVLSLMMRGLTFLFPLADNDDSATIAAISAAYHSIYPDKEITRIEETTK
jgi:hypothetical protein